MQEQDPRRDVSGCNRHDKRTLRSNPRKNRNQSTELNVFITNKKHSLGCVRNRCAQIPEKNQEEAYLTSQPLSEMSNFSRFAVRVRDGGDFHRRSFEPEMTNRELAKISERNDKQD